MGDILSFGIVKDFAHGGEIFAHDPFHAVKSAQHVRSVDHGGTAAADKNVLVPVGHAHHFMGNHLSDGENQIVGRIQNQFVHFHVDGIGDQTFGNGTDI